MSYNQGNRNATSAFSDNYSGAALDPNQQAQQEQYSGGNQTSSFADRQGWGNRQQGYTGQGTTAGNPYTTASGGYTQQHGNDLSTGQNYTTTEGFGQNRASDEGYSQRTAQPTSGDWSNAPGTQKRPSAGDRIKGTVEKMAGKITGDQDRVAHGENLSQGRSNW